jgi:hypothetical protein
MTQTIGQINGIWGILFRINQIVIPLIVAWAVWITGETFANRSFRDRGDRFTTMDGAALEARLMTVINALPPEDWRDRIKAAEERWIEIEQRLDGIERRQERILTLLGNGPR